MGITGSLLNVGASWVAGNANIYLEQNIHKSNIIDIEVALVSEDKDLVGFLTLFKKLPTKPRATSHTNCCF